MLNDDDYENDEYMGPDSPPLSWGRENAALTNYSFLFPFEELYGAKRLGYSRWLRYNWALSLWGFAAYVAFIFIGQKLMSYKEKPFDLRVPCIVWNAASAVFSVVGFARTSSELFRVLHRHGFQHSVCVSSYIQDGVFSFWISAFVCSKYFEFMDTAFLILRKRPVTFLHWYHHGTVLIFCWHGARTLTAAGRWFCWMNYGVHMVIYTYFAIRTYGVRCPNWIPPCITAVQMSQMVVGCVIGYVVYQVKSSGQECHHTWSNLLMAVAIYSTFFILFSRYFYNRYIRTTRTSSAPTKFKSSSPAAVEKPVHHHNQATLARRPIVIYSSNGDGETVLKSRFGGVPRPEYGYVEVNGIA